ncbi:energy transducer TonB [Lewinella sp. 4G2]|uniref:energy transducer TonB n=1 Tax=Lewinella sp. 4G2 TaxID=1803372 RepID=UPI0007DFFF93|nr:energy transducer TonB [Lewinella sp. 4G2]OAV43708.1 hypothetical protein A3850_003980 [Lewinella sp. 4G2]
MPQYRLLLTLPLLLILTACVSPRVTNNTPFKGRYAETYAPGEVELLSMYQYVQTKRGDTYIYRRFYPETKVMTHYTEYQDETFTRPHGTAKEWFDDGALMLEGEYRNGKQEGTFTEYFPDGQVYATRIYRGGEPDGKWIFNTQKDSSAARLFMERHYVDGQQEGTETTYDEDGQPTKIDTYEKGELISTQYRQDGKWVDESTWRAQNNELDKLQQLPLFPGCPDGEPYEDRKRCADRKLLEHIYGKVRYSERARQLEVEGLAKVSFVIEKDGTLTNIKVLRGLNRDIEREVIRIINSLPVWEPGRQDGEPVRVSFTLPVKFQLT